MRLLRVLTPLSRAHCAVFLQAFPSPAPPAPNMTRPIPLPLELLEQILDDDILDHRTLSACCRASKLFLAVARSRLYRQLEFRLWKFAQEHDEEDEEYEYTKGCAALLDIVNKHPDLAALVKGINFTVLSTRRYAGDSEQYTPYLPPTCTPISPPSPSRTRIAPTIEPASPLSPLSSLLPFSTYTSTNRRPTTSSLSSTTSRPPPTLRRIHAHCFAGVFGALEDFSEADSYCQEVGIDFRLVVTKDDKGLALLEKEAGREYLRPVGTTAMSTTETTDVDGWYQSFPPASPPALK